MTIKEAKAVFMMVKMRPIPPAGRHGRVVNFEHIQLLIAGLRSRSHERRIATLNGMRVVPVQLDPHILNILASDNFVSPLRSHSVRAAAANAIYRSLGDPKRTPSEKAKFMKPLIDALETAVYSEDHAFADCVTKALSLLKSDFITPDIVEDKLAPKVVTMLEHSSAIVSSLGIEVSRSLWGVLKNEETVIGALIILSYKDEQRAIGNKASKLLRETGYS